MTFWSVVREILTLTLNQDKIKPWLKHVKFMGHVLTDHGLEPDPDKIEAVITMQTPQNVEICAKAWRRNGAHSTTYSYGNRVGLVWRARMGILQKWKNWQRKPKFCDTSTPHVNLRSSTIPVRRDWAWLWCNVDNLSHTFAMAWLLLERSTRHRLCSGAIPSVHVW